MSKRDVLDVFRGWVELVTGLKVIYANDPEPTAPRPNVDASTFAYAAIDISSEGSDWSTVYSETTDTPAPDNKFEQHRSMPRQGTLEIELFGPGAMDYLHALEMSTGRDDALLYFDSLGDYAIKRPTDISDQPVLRSATREPGAEMAFVVEWIETETFGIEAVEEIVSTVEVDEE
jgi:hypothetical protein